VLPLESIYFLNLNFNFRVYSDFFNTYSPFIICSVMENIEPEDPGTKV
jgi:hypothetical protein